jgi:hypothetical protein
MAFQGCPALAIAFSLLALLMLGGFVFLVAQLSNAAHDLNAMEDRLQASLRALSRKDTL